MVKNHNTIFLIVIVIGLIIFLSNLTAYVFYNIAEAYDWIFHGIGICQIGGFFMLVANGTFILSKYYRVLKLLFSIITIGILFIVMQWPYPEYILIFGISGIIVNYFFSFLAKPNKGRLDYLKLLWVISFYGFNILKYFHLIKETYYIINVIFLWAAIIEYLSIENKKGTLFKKRE